MKRLLITTLLGLFTCCSLSYSGAGASYDYSIRHGLRIAPDVYWYRYEEPGVMQDEGILYGAHLDYTLEFLPDATDKKNPYSRNVESFFIRLETRAATGQVDYQSEMTGSIDGIDVFVVEPRLLLGTTWAEKGACWISPYFGIGYRYYTDDSGGMQSTTGQYGYKRESNYTYLPIGTRFAWTVTQRTSIGSTLEFDMFLTGIQKSHLGDVDPAYETLDNKQSSGYGVRGSLFIQFDLNAFDLAVEPYVRYWDIDDSHLAYLSDGTVGIEPENRTIEAGIQLGIIF